MEAAAAQQEHVHELAFWQKLTFFLSYLNQWAIVLGILFLELFLCVTILLPLPPSWRRSLGDGMARIWNKHPHFRIICWTVMGVVSVFFIDALRQMYSVHVAHTHPSVPIVGKAADLNVELVSAQRNAFLCFFTVYLYFVLLRFQSMADQINSLEEKIEQIEPGLSKHSEKHIQDKIGYDKNRQKVQ